MDRHKARVLKARRDQIEMQPVDLESLIPTEHRARTVWGFVNGLDLKPLYEKIKAVDGNAGRPTIDPPILMTLWLYATLEGIGGARALDRLCGEHNAYRWICGGVGVNYHSLSDFRVPHVEFLDDLLTRSVAALMMDGTVSLNRVAQDGVRVRANAGSSSFRRRKRLTTFLEMADEQVQRLRRELDEDPAASEKRQQAAKRRAARERQERATQALGEMEKIEAQYAARNAHGSKRKNPPPDTTASPPQDKREPRVSTTDPRARVMIRRRRGLSAQLQCAVCRRCRQRNHRRLGCNRQRRRLGGTAAHARPIASAL